MHRGAWGWTGREHFGHPAAAFGLAAAGAGPAAGAGAAASIAVPQYMQRATPRLAGREHFGQRGVDAKASPQ